MNGLVANHTFSIAFLGIHSARRPHGTHVTDVPVRVFDQVLETFTDPQLVHLVHKRHNFHKILQFRLVRHGELVQGPVSFFVMHRIELQIHNLFDLSVTIFVLVVHA